MDATVSSVVSCTATVPSTAAIPDVKQHDLRHLKVQSGSQLHGQNK